MRENIINHESDKELCALCGIRTRVLKTEDISTRYGYVKGVGLLCNKCYHEKNEQNKSKAMTLDESKRIQRGMAIKELCDRGNMVIFREKNPLSKESDRELLDILTEEYDVKIDMKGASFDENGFITNPGCKIILIK